MTIVLQTCFVPIFPNEMKLWLIILSLLIFCDSKAQLGTSANGRIEYLPHSTGDKKWKPLLGFDSRRSSFQSFNVKFRGVRLGAEHRGVHRFGFGFYGMVKGRTYDGIDIAADDATSDPKVKFEVAYSTLFYERVVILANRWDVATPLYLGGGVIKGSYSNVDGSFTPYLEERFSVLGTGFMGRYKVLPWLAPGIGAGYQMVFDSNREVKKTLQQPYYVIKVSILLGEFYQSTLKKWATNIIREHESESDF